MAAVSAVVSSKGKKVHIIAGRTYFWGMTIIFLTAIPMSIVSGNVFLFLILSNLEDKEKYKEIMLLV